MNDIATQLMALLDASPVNFLAAAYVEEQLKAAGFTPIRKVWDFPPNHPIQHISVVEDYPTVWNISEVLTLLDHTPT